jgi:hypothetical protein
MVSEMLEFEGGSKANCPDVQKWLMLSAAYAGKYKEARTYVLEKGQTVVFDADVLGAVISTGQIPLAIELLNEMKKSKPELIPQIDAYIKQLLSPVPTVAPSVKK